MSELPASSQTQVVQQLVALLTRIPPADRSRFARTHLEERCPEVVKAFDRIPEGQRGRSVLFLSLRAQLSREPRLAATARQAGWIPILLCRGRQTSDLGPLFESQLQLSDTLPLLLATWLFPGPIIHVFASHGADPYLFCRLKHRRIILDLYDTCAGHEHLASGNLAAERESLRLADGLVHRDLRFNRLRRAHGYSLPAQNIFILDPLSRAREVAPRVRLDEEIRVVALGWVNDGDSSIFQMAQSFCAGRVHVHVYLFPHPPTARDLDPFRRLQQLFPDHFHLEEPVFGPAYKEVLKQYDFGLTPCERHVFRESPTVNAPEMLRRCGSARLMDYIESGLGIIVTPERRFQYACACRYATAVVTPDLAMLRNPRPALEAALQNARTVPADRFHSITATAAGPRLARFYAEATADFPRPSGVVFATT